MVQIKGNNCSEAHEAILDIQPEAEDGLEKAFDTLSDLFDLVHDTSGEILSSVNKEVRQLLETDFEFIEARFMLAQKLLNGLIEARNAKITK